ncbi:hypothetical protein VCHA53O466_50287 [Vibrio chagasii]|nr:hypothetical protein VCHA53O466_50287 [Vibrio chagasii]
MNAQQPKVNNKAIAYRSGDFTSKFTVHPTMYEALTHKLQSENEAREFMRNLAIKSLSRKVSATSYVREEVMKALFPSECSGKTSTKLIELKFKLSKQSKEVKKTKNTVSIVTMGDKMLKLCAKFENEGKTASCESPLTELINEIYTENQGKDVSFRLKETLLKKYAFQ